MIEACYIDPEGNVLNHPSRFRSMFECRNDVMEYGESLHFPWIFVEDECPDCWKFQWNCFRCKAVCRCTKAVFVVFPEKVEVGWDDKGKLPRGFINVTAKRLVQITHPSWIPWLSACPKTRNIRCQGKFCNINKPYGLYEFGANVRKCFTWVENEGQTRLATRISWTWASSKDRAWTRNKKF